MNVVILYIRVTAGKNLSIPGRMRHAKRGLKELDRRHPHPMELVRQGSKAAGAGAVAGAAVGAVVGALAGAFAGAVAFSFATLGKEAWRRYRDRGDHDDE
jgi:hypothetical protein